MMMTRNNINYVGEIGEFIIFPEAKKNIKKFTVFLKFKFFVNFASMG